MTEGLLQEIPLAQVIQLILISNQTGKLELTALFPISQPKERIPIGQIFFRDGHILAAFLEQRQGEKAMENLFLWEAGWFTFQVLAPDDLPPPNITTDTRVVIFKGITRQDDWRSARELIPTQRIVLQHGSLPAGTPLPPDHSYEAQILNLCDGQSQLATIADRLHIGRLKCREYAANLVRAQLAFPLAMGWGERLLSIVATEGYAMLGVGAELFGEDGLRAVGIVPELLARVAKLSIAQVAQVVVAIGRDVASVLGPERARELAQRLNVALGLAVAPAPEMLLGGNA